MECLQSLSCRLSFFDSPVESSVEERRIDYSKSFSTTQEEFNGRIDKIRASQLEEAIEIGVEARAQNPKVCVLSSLPFLLV